MAQPLVKTEPEMQIRAGGGIDQAAMRLEKAFARLEAASQQLSTGHRSLRIDHEKLGGLMRGAEEEIGRLREVTGTVNARLDQIIYTLERME